MLQWKELNLFLVIFCVILSYAVNWADYSDSDYAERQGRLIDITQFQPKLQILSNEKLTEKSTRLRPRPPPMCYTMPCPPPIYYPPYQPPYQQAPPYYPPPQYHHHWPPHNNTGDGGIPPSNPPASPIAFCDDPTYKGLIYYQAYCGLPAFEEINLCQPFCSMTYYIHSSQYLVTCQIEAPSMPICHIPTILEYPHPGECTSSPKDSAPCCETIYPRVGYILDPHSYRRRYSYSCPSRRHLSGYDCYG